MSVQRLKFHGGAYYHLFMVAEIESILHPTEHDVGIHTRGGSTKNFSHQNLEQSSYLSSILTYDLLV